MSTIPQRDNIAIQQIPPTAYPPRRKTEVLKDWLFEKVHGNKLVYNTCWEDPRCDRAMLGLNDESDVVMITSAGDNALDYLLDGPRQINCIDVNSRQNALLELKLAGLNSLDWKIFFRIFGEGRLPDFNTVYSQKLRPTLSSNSRQYWDRQQHYFSPSGSRAGLYFHGSSGLFAWCANQVLSLDGVFWRELQQLLESKTLSDQSTRYASLEPRLLKRLLGSRLRQRISLSLVGVPEAQRQFINMEIGGLEKYVRAAFSHIFTCLPISDNYFYRLYLNGKYTEDCCPEYLKQDNFSLLRQNKQRIVHHTTTITNFLKHHPKAYSHFVLLDHQDWLAANAPAALAEEWQLIMANSKAGTLILLRSAAVRPETVPDFVRARVSFRKDLSAPQAKLDRVGTYAGTFLLEVVK